MSPSSWTATGAGPRERGLARPAGHQAGARAVREAVEGALQAGVEVLTLFAFSQENWQRPPAEIDALMALLEEYIAKEADELRREGVAVRMLGDLAPLSPSALEAIDRIESSTRGRGSARPQRLPLLWRPRRDRACRAASRRAGRPGANSTRPRSTTPRLPPSSTPPTSPDPDLLIRTSGEMRVSNFLLWQVAYAEFHVTPVLWPDFTREDLFAAILEFQRRDRRFGRVSA